MSDDCRTNAYYFFLIAAFIGILRLAQEIL
jgi:hypothetical protein